MDNQRAVGFPAQDAPAAHDDHASIRQEVEAQRNRGLANDDLTLSLFFLERRSPFPVMFF
jgi:hypothetical protein